MATSTRQRACRARPLFCPLRGIGGRSRERPTIACSYLRLQTPARAAPEAPFNAAPPRRRQSSHASTAVPLANVALCRAAWHGESAPECTPIQYRERRRALPVPRQISQLPPAPVFPARIAQPRAPHIEWLSTGGQRLPRDARFAALDAAKFLDAAGAVSSQIRSWRLRQEARGTDAGDMPDQMTKLGATALARGARGAASSRPWPRGSLPRVP